MKWENCYTSVCLTVGLSAVLLLISPIYGASIAVGDDDVNNELDNNDGNRINSLESAPANYHYLKEIVSKRSNLRYLQNVLAQLDDRLEKIQDNVMGIPKPKRRPPCLSGIPAGDCDNHGMGNEGASQDYLRPGGRNPGRKRRSLVSHHSMINQVNP